MSWNSQTVRMSWCLDTKPGGDGFVLGGVPIFPVCPLCPPVYLAGLPVDPPGLAVYPRSLGCIGLGVFSFRVEAPTYIFSAAILAIGKVCSRQLASQCPFFFQFSLNGPRRGFRCGIGA